MLPLHHDDDGDKKYRGSAGSFGGMPRIRMSGIMDEKAVKTMATQFYFSKEMVYLYVFILLCNVVLFMGIMRCIHIDQFYLHFLEALLTLILLLEVLLRIVVNGSFTKYLNKGWENAFDFGVLMISLFLLVSDWDESWGACMQELFGESLVLLRTIIRIVRLGIFFRRHHENQGVVDDEIDFMQVESGKMVELYHDHDI